MHLPNRIADPAEVGRVALFLCADDASFVTGRAYVVDGG
jgi:NAD(P)-dependent dehydrogenase (short-subunit alcohol dehydrogenase family)